MTVYEAMYSPMTWENSSHTISIHLSKEGAENAIANHRKQKEYDWCKLFPDERFHFNDKSWHVKETKVLP